MAFAYAWRVSALGGLVAGLALAAPLGRGAPVGLEALVALGVALALARPRHGRAGTVPWLVLVCAVAVLAGLAIGSGRLEAIDRGGLAAEPGDRLELRGTVVSAPRTSGELTRFTLDTPEGRIAVELRAPSSSSSTFDTPRAEVLSDSGGFPAVGAIDEGRVVDASGSVREPAAWERSQIERSGASVVLAADSVRVTAAARGGLRGALDDVRRRAESALERGTHAPAAALLRGFVLGQDDLIAEDVREDFRRSGLAHVLAVPQKGRTQRKPAPRLDILTTAPTAGAQSPSPPAFKSTRPKTQSESPAKEAAMTEQAWNNEWLPDFVRESNRIEGIVREPTGYEMSEHEDFLRLRELTVPDVERFVREVAAAPLRDRVGLNVRVGNHVPPPGGPEIRKKLEGFLWGLSQPTNYTPYSAHVWYEQVHPFMDGNGRSGRVIWAWYMRKLGQDPFALPFLRCWYYQSLEASEAAMKPERDAALAKIERVEAEIEEYIDNTFGVEAGILARKIRDRALSDQEEA